MGTQENGEGGMSEMVERVAKAIANNSNLYGCDPKNIARAAIEAMREPTEAMEKAVSGDEHIDQDPRYYWPLMIDAALK